MSVKNVCFNCVNDRYLGAQIQRKGISAVCSLCSTKRRCFPLTEIVARVDRILGQYICEGEVAFRWRNDGPSQHQEGESIDIRVSEIFGCDNIEPIVVAVCRELTSYSDEVNYSVQEFTSNDIGLRWCEFQDGMKHGNRFFNQGAKAFLDLLFHGLDKYSASSDEQAVVRKLTPESAPSFFRARTCLTPADVTQITSDPSRNLGAPPRKRAGEGRMNPAGVPAFYGAFDRLTCIAELRPPVGGAVVSGQFKLTKEVTVLDFGRFEKADLGPVPSFFEPKYFEKAGRRDFLRYLHNEITLPVLPGMERDYLTTQVIAEYLATHCKPRIDGVIFKSVQSSSGNNIVLFSHAACAPEPMQEWFNGGAYISGAQFSDGPCIEYVPGSLVRHEIQGVVYTQADHQLVDEGPTPVKSIPRFLSIST